MNSNKVDFHLEKTWCKLIRTLVQKNELDRAKRETAILMGEYPHAPQPHNFMGIILEKENCHIEAMKHFRAAWALDPTYMPARYNMNQYMDITAHFHPIAYEEEDCIEKSNQHKKEEAPEHDNTISSTWNKTAI